MIVFTQSLTKKTVFKKVMKTSNFVEKQMPGLKWSTYISCYLQHDYSVCSTKAKCSSIMFCSKENVPSGPPGNAVSASVSVWNVYYSFFFSK